MLGGHFIKAWSRTQGTVALSSAEAELHAMVKTSSELLGILSMLNDLKIRLVGEIFFGLTFSVEKSLEAKVSQYLNNIDLNMMEKLGKSESPPRFQPTVIV